MLYVEYASWSDPIVLCKRWQGSKPNVRTRVKTSLAPFGAWGLLDPCSKHLCPLKTHFWSTVVSWVHVPKMFSFCSRKIIFLEHGPMSPMFQNTQIFICFERNHACLGEWQSRGQLIDQTQEAYPSYTSLLGIVWGQWSTHYIVYFRILYFYTWFRFFWPFRTIADYLGLWWLCRSINDYFG